MKNILKLTLAIGTHFGHEWASVVRDAQETERFLSATRRSGAFADTPEADMRGIPYPELSWAQTTHTTGSGRIQIYGTCEKFTINALSADLSEIVCQAVCTARGGSFDVVPLAVSHTKHMGHVGMVFGNVQGILQALGAEKVLLHAPLNVGVIPRQEDECVEVGKVLATAEKLFNYLEYGVVAEPQIQFLAPLQLL